MFGYTAIFGRRLRFVMMVEISFEWINFKFSIFRCGVYRLPKSR